MRRRKGTIAAPRRASARAVAPLAAACLGLAVAGCEEEAPEPEEVARPVKIFEVRGGGATVTREYPGRIKAVQQADMAFEVAGRITEFVYKEGERAEAGAVLARLDQRDYQNQLAQARAVERNRRTYLARIAKAHETRAVSDQDLADAQAQARSESKLVLVSSTNPDCKLCREFNIEMPIQRMRRVRSRQEYDLGDRELGVLVPHRGGAGYHA